MPNASDANAPRSLLLKGGAGTSHVSTTKELLNIHPGGGCISGPTPDLRKQKPWPHEVA